MTLGIMDRASAASMVHEEQSTSQRYALLITALDWERGLAQAHPGDYDYYNRRGGSDLRGAFGVARDIAAWCAHPLLMKRY
jgi:hypothetical protein